MDVLRGKSLEKLIDDLYAIELHLYPILFVGA